MNLKEVKVSGKFLTEISTRNFNFGLKKGCKVNLIKLTESLKQKGFFCELEQGKFNRLKLLEKNVGLFMYSSGKGTFYGDLLKEVGVCGVELFLCAFFEGYVVEFVYSKTQ